MNCPSCGNYVGCDKYCEYCADWRIENDLSIMKLLSQLKESQDRADLMSKALESANESVKEWEATAKGWMLFCEKAQARVKVLEEALGFYAATYNYYTFIEEDNCGDKARAALKDGE